jgi:DNA-binding XRE family transcriptional regulator
MSQLIGPAVNRRKQSRDALAYKLHLLGWTQERIGEVVGVDRRTVSVIAKNFNTKLFSNEYESGLTPEIIASNHNLDETLVSAILLEGKEDIERFRLFSTKDYGTDESGGLAKMGEGALKVHIAT